MESLNKNGQNDIERNLGGEEGGLTKISGSVGQLTNLRRTPLTGSREELYVKDDEEESRRGWKDYNSLERSLWIALGFVSATAIAFIVGVAVLGMKLNDEDDTGPVTKAPPTTLMPPWLTWAPSTTTKGPPTKPSTTTKPPGCETEDCIINGGRIMAAMNTSASPCENFYNYACGNWAGSHLIPDYYGHWDQNLVLSESLVNQIRKMLESETTTDNPFKLAQTFYSSCTKQVNKTVELGNFVEGFVNETMTANLGKIRLDLGGNYILSMFVDLDEMHTDNYTIYIDQPDLGIPRPFLIDPLPNKYRDAYTTLIMNTWTELYPTDTNPQEIANNIVTFESSLAKISTRPEDRRNKKDMYNVMKINELKKTIEWEEYFVHIFVFLNSTFEVSGETTVIVRDIPFFEKLDSILTESAQEIIRDYLRWRIIFKLANEVSPVLQSLMFEFSRVTEGILVLPLPIWKTCAETTNSHFGMAVSYQYIQEGYFTQGQKDAVYEMTEDVKNAFISNLMIADWMTNDTRDMIEEKVERIQSNIGFPDWPSNEALVEFYEDLEPSEDHFNNVKAMLAWTSRKQLKDIEMTKDTQRWTTFPTDMNAFYLDIYNSMTFPAALLKVPLFGMSLEYLNYGAMGSIIGQQLIHAFDESGRQNDANGTLTEWDEITLTNYTNMAQCFVSQYNNYSLNGEETLDENVAGIGGLNLAYDAYQDFVTRHGIERLTTTFTVDQLFFLSYAQMFCGSDTATGMRGVPVTPPKYRVNGVVANSFEFAQAWQCTEHEMCQIW